MWRGRLLGYEKGKGILVREWKGKERKETKRNGKVAKYGREWKMYQ